MRKERHLNGPDPWQGPSIDLLHADRPPRDPSNHPAPKTQTQRFLWAAVTLMGLISGAACGVLFTQLLAAAADRISLPTSPHSGSAGTAVVILLTVPLTFAGTVIGAWLAIRICRRREQHVRGTRNQQESAHQPRC